MSLICPPYVTHMSLICHSSLLVFWAQLFKELDRVLRAQQSITIENQLRKMRQGLQHENKEKQSCKYEIYMYIYLFRYFLQYILIYIYIYLYFFENWFFEFWLPTRIEFLHRACRPNIDCKQQFRKSITWDCRWVLLQPQLGLDMIPRIQLNSKSFCLSDSKALPGCSEHIEWWSQRGLLPSELATWTNKGWALRNS